MIVDSGGANLASIQYAFERLGARAIVTADGSTIASADRVVLPGVGAAGHVMQRLKDAGARFRGREQQRPRRRSRNRWSSGLHATTFQHAQTLERHRPSPKQDRDPRDYPACLV